MTDSGPRGTPDVDIGAYALVSGALFIALGFRLRHLNPRGETHARAIPTQPRHVGRRARAYGGALGAGC